MNSRKIGFIGTGRIAQALISGLVKQPGTTIAGYDKNQEALARVAAQFGISAKASIAELADAAEVIIIAVKPYQVGDVLDELRPALKKSQLIISVAAGISTAFIESLSPAGTRVVRVMPNTPAFVGKGMTALCHGRNATGADLAIAEGIFCAIGRTASIDEQSMDAATGLSGSGPAYVFRIIDALAEGGVVCGLDRKTALLLAAQTVLGAATMVLESEKSPDELARDVTTPGGTTEAGLREMDRRQVKEALVETTRAAAERSRELMK